jgi:dihydropteroate synthase
LDSLSERSILAALPELADWGHPVVIGVSRKRFVGDIARVQGTEQRVYGSVGANVAALERGARVFRVHEVAPHRQALDVAWAIATHAAYRETSV